MGPLRAAAHASVGHLEQSLVNGKRTSWSAVALFRLRKTLKTSMFAFALFDVFPREGIGPRVPDGIGGQLHSYNVDLLQ